MKKKTLILVLTTKALRSLSNGLFCATFIPYIKYCHLKTYPITIGLTIFVCALFSSLKTKYINHCYKSPMLGLYLAYLFFLPSFFLNLLNIGGYQTNILSLLIFVLGLYPIDGEDFAFFHQAELDLIVK